MRLNLLITTALVITTGSPQALAQEAAPVQAETSISTEVEAGSTEPEVIDPGPPNLDGGTSYGLFLAGRSAMSNGDVETAVALLSAALAGAGGDQLVRERTFSAAILAGDIRVAATTPLSADETHVTIVEASRLAQATLAMLDGRSRSIYNDIQARPIAAPHVLAGRLLERWLAADAGDWNTALEPISQDSDALSHILGGYYRALLLEHRRRYNDAEAQYQALMLDGTAASMTRLPYGEFLERRRRRDEAIAVYDAGLALRSDPMLQAARARAASRGRAPRLMNIRQGAALAFGHAAAAAAVSDVHEFVIAYLQMSLALNPDRGEGWIMLGDALAEIGMPSTARQAWARTDPNQPEYIQAQIQIAASLDEAGLGEEAVQVARAVANREPGPASAYTLAALLAGHDRFDEALQVLDTLATSQVLDTSLLFLKGAIHEQNGQYAEAEAAFSQALEQAPDQPEILNYLGYMWVDRGDRIEEGLALIERAVAAEPQNGNYQDSLGWARYRLGQYDEAVRLLELAVNLSPESAVINDHLGDAYWQIGRTREAEFQWRRALTLDPSDTERQAVEAKLAGHPPSVSAPTAP